MYDMNFIGSLLRGDRVKLILSGLLFVITWSVHSDEITYNYWDFGASLANRQSDYVADDITFYGDFNISRNLLTFPFGDYKLGVHVWTDGSLSRNISDTSAYRLSLLQVASGFGADYTTDVVSTYFHVGIAASFARFESRSGRSSIPILPMGSGDIFVPPISIFSQTRSQVSYTNEEYGNLVKIGIRYRVSDGYEIGAAILQSDMDSFGTELSAYAQRDFGILFQVPGIAFTNMSLKLSTRISDLTKSMGLSLVLSY